MKFYILIVLLLGCMNNTLQLDPNNYELLRVLTFYLNRGLTLECPDTGLPDTANVNVPQNLLVWVNETGQSDKNDEDLKLILLTPDSNARYKYVFSTPVTDLSCGYYFKNKYTRIKKWKLIYIDRADIELVTQIDRNSILLNPINSSHNAIQYLKSSQSLNQLTNSEIFKLSCKTNFDIPLGFTLIWLNLKTFNTENAQLINNESWRRFYNDRIQADQKFERNSSDERDFVELLKVLFTAEPNSISIELTCSRYIYISERIADSKNYVLVKTGAGPKKEALYSGLTETELILVIVFTILGFLLLLALILFLIWCFCCRRQKTDKSSNNKKITKKSTKRDNAEIQESKHSRIIENEPAVIATIPAVDVSTLNNQANSNQNKLVYRSSIHLDSPQMHSASNRYNPAAVNSMHLSSAPNLYEKKLTMHKDPYEDSLNINKTYNYNNGFKEYNYDKYQNYKDDPQDQYFYRKETENFYEIKTTRYMPNTSVPSISASTPYEARYSIKPRIDQV